MIESIFFAVESKNSIFSTNQSLVWRWSKTSLNCCDAWTLAFVFDCRLFMICAINRNRSASYADENSIELELKLFWFIMSCSLWFADISLECRLCFKLILKLIDDSSLNEFSLICRLTSSKKDLSNCLTVFLKSDLSVIHFSDQERENSDAFEIVRIRSTSADVDDLIWCNVISTNLFFVENDIKRTYWWSLSINSINSKIKSMRFLLTVRLLDWSL